MKVLIPAKNLPSLDTLPLTTSSNVMENAHPVVLKLFSISPALTNPMTEAIILNSKAKIRTTVGQINSHFVYCSFSGFWQHLDGQQLVQTQQQQRKGQIKRITRNPMIKGPIKIIIEVAVPSKELRPLLTSVTSPSIKLLPSSLKEASIPAIY